MDEWEIQEMIGALREQARVLAGEQLIARIPAREAELSQQIDNRNHQANINAAINVLWTAIESVVSYRIPEAAYYLSAAKAVTDTTEITMDDIAQALRDAINPKKPDIESMTDILMTLVNSRDLPVEVAAALATTDIINQIVKLVTSKPFIALNFAWAAITGARSALDIPLPSVERVWSAYDAFYATVDDGQPVPYGMAVDPAMTHVVLEQAYADNFSDLSWYHSYYGVQQVLGSRNYADSVRAIESLGIGAHQFPAWLFEKKQLVDRGISTWQEVLMDQARQRIALGDAQNHTPLTSESNRQLDPPSRPRAFGSGGRLINNSRVLYADAFHYSPRLPDSAAAAGDGLNGLGSQLAHVSDSAFRLRDATGTAGFELWELEHPLLRIRDHALGLTDAMGGQGMAGVMDGAGVAADGLALSSAAAGQALLSAGLTSTAVTQVLGIMSQAGLDLTTINWDDPEDAVRAWGAAQAGAGSVYARMILEQLMALAQDIAKHRARMGGLAQETIDHELAKLPRQLRAPDSFEEKLALLQLFFAGTAHGIAFGLGPSVQQLGFTIPQFASGGIVSNSYGVSPPVAAHGGEHIIPHRATGNPIIVDMKMDREVLSQAVLGDLLRLQGREVTLGLS